MKNKFFLLTLSLFFTLFEKINSKRPKKSYRNGEKVNLISGTVNSFKTQIPFDLYYLDVCVPEDVLLIPSNLGETLLSGKSYQTNFELSINESKVGQLLCTKKISKTAFKRINNLIHKEYFVNYFLDNLPGGLAHTYFNTSTKEIRYSTGVPIGFVKNNQAYINNYFRINVQLNKINLSILVNKTKRDDDDEYVDVPAFDIISFSIEPFSIKMNNVNDKINKIINSGIEYENQIFNVSEDIIFRYDTFYTYTDTIYEERYFKFFYGDKFIHTNSVYISGLIILILLIILTYIYFRAIKSESEIHNEKVTSEESINEYGWRNIAFDVFRRPIRSDILSSLIGTGIQLLIMLLYSLSFVVLGIIQPKSGGSYFTLLAMVYIFLSLISGYASARFYKMVHGLNWLRVCIFTAIFFPMTLILSLSSTNFLYYLEGSTTYVEFKNFFSLLSLWIIGTIPLIFIGTMIGLSQKRVKFPCDVNPVPGILSKNNYPWYLRIRYAWFLTGFPPFFAIFVELFYIMDSLWKQDYYALSKYLLLSIIILIIISSLIGILFTYLNLCKGDYRWWWKSFVVSASPAIYIIIFFIFYLFKLKFKQITTICIYINFMFLFSIIIALVCGSSGLCLTYLFLENIYSKIKIT